MIIYHSDVKGFKSDQMSGTLVEKLERQVRESYKQSSPGEITSWRNSLSYMHMVINDSSIPDDVGVAIEYMIPTTSKRIDFLLSGYDQNKKPSVVIIELKQWEKANKVEEKNDIVKTFIGGGMREVTHPCYQAWSYAAALEDFNEAVHTSQIGLYPCAYLHNYLLEKNNDPLTDDKYQDILDKAPMFSQTDSLKLREFINRYVKKGDQGKILYTIDNGRIRPSKSLQDRLQSMLDGNQEFIMIDDQKVVYESVLSMAEKTKRDSKKRVMIVEGGPGTGKSVISINLLCELIARGRVTHYITKNAAPRNVYKTKLKGSYTISSIDNLFKNSGAYYEANENELDIAIVDEAHRLNKKSGLFGNKGENQIKEIIFSSKCSVFFVDDDQRITAADIGSKEEIMKQAQALDAIILTDSLESQFRCNGSDSYIAWLDDVLQVRETANKILDFDYDIDVVNSPQELLNWVISKNDNNKARIIAGYCWEWPKKERNNPEYKDIVIEEHNFAMSWNFSQGVWAIDPNSVDQAGCIHTAQGLEFDYIGVIIGPDLFYEDGKVVTDSSKRAKSDQSLKSLKGCKKTDPEEAEEIADTIIRNTYRTLMTRGMKACRVFCVDKALGEYLKQRISAVQVDYSDLDTLDCGALRVADGYGSN